MKIVYNLDKHPWRSLLTHLKRHFLNTCDKTCVLYDAFVPGAAVKNNAQGERIWATYGIGAECNPCWWECDFTDSGVDVRKSGCVSSGFRYGQVVRVILPKKNSLATEVTCGNIKFKVDSAAVLLTDGSAVEVFGLRTVSGRFDAYYWHTLIAAHIDARRDTT